MPGFIHFTLERQGRRPLLEGRDMQGCALALIRLLEPKLSARLHDNPHSYSVCAPNPKEDVLRVGLARDEDMEQMGHALLRSTRAMEARLGNEPVVISRVAMGRDRECIPWPALGLELMEAPRLAWTLRLLTPTFFRDGGRDFPDVVRMAPSPERVLGSLRALAMRLNAPLPGYPHETPWRFVNEHTMDVHTKGLKVHFHGRRRQFQGTVGALGWRLRDAPPEVARWIAALLELGRFVGVGSRTCMGLGAVEVKATPGRNDGR